MSRFETSACDVDVDAASPDSGSLGLVAIKPSALAPASPVSHSGIHEVAATRPTIVAPRGHSSVGRAPALQAGGRRFEPGWLHPLGLRDTAAALNVRNASVTRDRFSHNATVTPSQRWSGALAGSQLG